jgi:hypothetical protein
LLTLHGEVDVDVATVELATCFGGMGFACVGGVDEFNVAESEMY